MDRLIASGSVPATGADVAPTVGVPQFATSGNPQTGIPATLWAAYQYNAIQEELIAIINAAGLVPDRTNNAQVLAALRALIRIKQNAPLTLYVATNGNDNNPGTNASQPFLTIEGAINALYSQYDLNGNTCTINIAPGTYTAPVSVAGRPLGGGTVLLIGAGAGTTFISSLTSAGISVGGGANVTVQSMSVGAPGPAGGSFGNGGIGINVGGGASVALNGVTFTGCTVAHISVSDAVLTTNGYPYTITNGAQFHINAGPGSRVYMPNTAVTVTGNPAFSIAFARAYSTGVIECQGSTFSGSATGTRYQVYNNAVIDTGGNGSPNANLFPGNAAGVPTQGGQYV